MQFRLRTLTRLASNFLLYAFFAGLYIWSVPAVYFLDYPYDWMKPASACIFVLMTLLLIIRYRKWRAGFWLVCLICLMIASIYSVMPASNNRNWVDNVAVLPSVTINGNIIHVRHIRDFEYRTPDDYKIRYYDRTYDAARLDSLDYVLSYWDGNKKIAHSMLTFGFADGSHLCVSVETRLKKGQVQTGLMGLYNQYGLIYILGDERDILKLRTDYRKEEVYLYPMSISKENIRRYFLTIMERISKLEQHPQFYNTVKYNCMTNLLIDAENAAGSKIKFDYRFILNGLSDEMMYEHGVLKTDGLSFAELKKKCYISHDTSEKLNTEDYSIRIRKNR